MHTRVGALVVIFVLVAANADAGAPERRAAAQLFERGRALFGEARYDEALLAFEAGYRVYPLRGFLVNIGQCHRKLDRLDDAAQAWRQFLDSNPSDARLRREVEEALTEVEGERARRVKVAALTAPAPVLVELRREEAPPTVENLIVTAPPPARSRMPKWGWALVGIVAAGAVAAAVGVGVTQAEAQTPRAGSLGIIDGRR